jgi:hypothetical protein
MKTLSQTNVSAFHALLAWGTGLIARFRAAMAPRYTADQIAADVAATGNPSGV